MRTTKPRWVVQLAGLVGLAVGGCGGSTDADKVAPADKSKPGAAARQPSPATAGGNYRIVIITNGSSPFWDAVDRGMQDAGKSLGVRVELIRNDATEGGQIRRLEQVAAQSDIQGVGVSVLEAQAEGVADQMRALRAKGVHVLAIDSDGPKDARLAFVGTNNLEAGRELGRAAQQLRPDGGKAVCFVGLSGAQNARERIQGFEEGAGDKIQRIDTMDDGVDESKARRNVVAAMQNHPEMNILAGIWSYNAPAIADVVKESGRRKDYTVVTFDAEPNAIRAMQEGLIDVMVLQNPYEMGYQGVVLLNALIQGDQATVESKLKRTDNYDTGLKVVVPNDSSLIQSQYRVTLDEFKKWLNEKGLEGS